MQRYQQADTTAAATLVNELSPQMFHFFLGQVRDRSRAEDLLQDFWLRIHNARHTYRPPEPVLPWLYAIARRVRIDQYRRSRAIAEHEMQTEVLPERPESAPSSRSTLDMRELLKTLPPAQREVILMLKVSGLTLEEVALATGSSVGSVKQKAHRAYEKLRKLFGASR